MYNVTYCLCAPHNRLTSNRVHLLLIFSLSLLLLFLIWLFSTPALTEILFSSLLADSLIVITPAETFEFTAAMYDLHFSRCHVWSNSLGTLIQQTTSSLPVLLLFASTPSTIISKDIIYYCSCTNINY